MSTTRIHHALPAPVVHQGFSVHQSKSHVLAGVQDAYWSDDEAEDAECPLCLEEMDISDLNFKPCVCGYQICRFCWHHIKENLNKRCPACRRVYTDDAVEFKAIATQDHKRLMQQKKQRERERKELETLGRRNLANVRVVQRNVVYVVGIGPRFAKEELIPTLRSHEYFGQYGKINKILLVKRNPSGGSPVLGVYITYHRREDAARAIAAVDGSPSPSGGREVMRASYGTTKYCMSFLRSVPCSDHNCMNLHEWGDEKDCFTKEDLTTLKHTMKTTESRARTVVASKNEAEGLPKAAAWGHRSSSTTPATTASSSALSATPRRRGGAPAPRPSRPAVESRPSNGRLQERKTAAPKPSSASSSRPVTPAPASLPARPASPSVKGVKSPKVSKAVVKEAAIPVPTSSQSPAPSVATGSDAGSHEATPASPRERPQSASPAPSSIPSVPPGLPAVPPGLSAPPGLPAPRPPRVDTASPQTPLLASQTTYQMSTAARALLDDVKARRESLLPSAPVQSPFPDFDRTLQNLTAGDSEFGGFTFNLDPKLASSEDVNEESLPDLEVEAATPFVGNFMQAFPALRPPGLSHSNSYTATPSGIPYPHNPTHSIYDPSSVRSTPIESQSTGSSNYVGSFDPFADHAEEPPHSGSPSPAKLNALDDDPARRVSRFGFARGRQTTSRTHTASPLHVSSIAQSVSESTNSIYHPSPVPHSPAPSQWSLHSRQDYPYQQPSSAMASPLVSHSQPPGLYPSGQQTRFQPFDNNGNGAVTEVQLRELLQSSRVGATASREPQGYKVTSGQQGFVDPAIMSARFSSQDPSYLPMDQSYGPPPGLSFPEGMQHNVGMTGNLLGVNDGTGHAHEPLLPSDTTDTPPLDPSEFPALSSTLPAESAPSSEDKQTTADVDLSPEDLKAKEKAELKAAKKAASAERAAERQRIAQEKAAVKAAEKAKVAQEKAAEKEKAAALKAQQEKERAEKERVEKEKAKAERLAKAEREKAAQAEREKAAQVEKERAAKKAAAAAAKSADTLKTPGKKANQPAVKVANPSPEESTQVPLLSKKPKKNKPIAKPIKVPTREEDHVQEDTFTIPSASASDAHLTAKSNTGSSSNSRSQSVERNIPTSLADLLEEIYVMNPTMELADHPFFDIHKINPAAKMPLEYGPLVHALSALSVGGGSFANNVPSGSIDNAVSSFQQLLETLTQTISDLLRLLPRTTWDDSSSFDGVLRDMLKGDDFLDDNGEDGQGREDEVAALTLALERRARWMEVQLSKLEELHRDINNAAVRAVLAFNDSGWDRHGFMPRIGNTVRRFDSLGMIEDEDLQVRPMTIDELEEKLAVAKEAAVFAETELREMMESMQAVKPIEEL
ncbi:transcriptional repressor general negative regulator of transcription subunit 4 [Marasmius tenuissimus]|nr:transcriptional repressor general negative regulator of transcription subunit 4 [Marasmius tenuissimus]